MKTQVAVDALCESLNAIPSSTDDQQWKERADIIINFAEGVSKEVLLRCGINEADKDWIHKSLVNVLDPSDGVEAIPDFVGPMVQKFQDLYLEGIRSDLSNTEENTSICEHEFAFCRGRVVEWDNKRQRLHRVMTYEETARFVIFWLAEKILQIIRKNEWDRVRHLPDLYDRLATFFTSTPTQTPELQSVAELRVQLGLKYDPSWLLQQRRNTLLDYGFAPTLRRFGVEYPYVPDLVGMTEDQFVELVDKHARPKMAKRMKEVIPQRLAKVGLSFGMQISQEVLDWCKKKDVETRKEWEQQEQELKSRRSS